MFAFHQEKCYNKERMTMKKQVLILLTILIILSIVVVLAVQNYQRQQFVSKQANRFYENYLNKPIAGTDLITVINKAMDENEKNKVKKDKIYFQENDENSIKIEIHFLEEKRTILMEDIAKASTERFIKFFGQAKFTCTNVSYHSKTGKIKYLSFQQV